MRFSLLTLLALVLLISGVILLLVFPVFGMINSFNKIAESGGNASPATLAEDISRSLLAAVWGIVHVLLGIVLLVVRFFQRKQEKRRELNETKSGANNRVNGNLGPPSLD